MYLFILRQHETIIHNEPTPFFNLLSFFCYYTLQGVFEALQLQHIYNKVLIILLNTLYYITFSLVFNRFCVFFINKYKTFL